MEESSRQRWDQARPWKEFCCTRVSCCLRSFESLVCARYGSGSTTCKVPHLEKSQDSHRTFFHSVIRLARLVRSPDRVAGLYKGSELPWGPLEGTKRISRYTGGTCRRQVCQINGQSTVPSVVVGRVFGSRCDRPRVAHLHPPSLSDGPTCLGKHLGWPGGDGGQAAERTED